MRRSTKSHCVPAVGAVGPRATITCRLGSPGARPFPRQAQSRAGASAASLLAPERPPPHTDGRSLRAWNHRSSTRRTCTRSVPLPRTRPAVVRSHPGSRPSWFSHPPGCTPTQWMRQAGLNGGCERPGARPRRPHLVRCIACRLGMSKRGCTAGRSGPGTRHHGEVVGGVLDPGPRQVRPRIDGAESALHALGGLAERQGVVLERELGFGAGQRVDVRCERSAERQRRWT